jgi:hypothetical protein
VIHHRQNPIITTYNHKCLHEDDHHLYFSDLSKNNKGCPVVLETIVIFQIQDSFTCINPIFKIPYSFEHDTQKLMIYYYYYYYYDKSEVSHLQQKSINASDF